MLVVISPAKRLDWTPRGVPMTEPVFAADASRLAGHARQLTLARLRSLMSLSDDLARLNRDRFRAFSAEPASETLRPAIFAFAGDTYQGLEADTLGPDALARAQTNLRILSGLYGVLRPLDAIQPYRLEMGTRLATRRGATLYDYWGARIALELNASAEETGAKMLVNCASQEYFAAVDRAALRLPVVTPHFYEVKAGEAKIVSFFAKKARGAMARFILERRVTSVEGLRDFDLGGYRLVASRSSETDLVFHRDAEAAARDAAA